MEPLNQKKISPFTAWENIPTEDALNYAHQESLIKWSDVLIAITELKEKRRRYVCSGGKTHHDEPVITWEEFEQVFGVVEKE